MMTVQDGQPRTAAAARYFGKVVRVGVAVNLILAIPAVVAPALVLGLFELETGDRDIWARFAAWLLVLLSLFYLPAAKEPFRSLINSWLTVFARLGGVGFFLGAVFIVGESPRLLALASIDLVFGLAEGVLLWLALSERFTRSGNAQ